MMSSVQCKYQYKLSTIKPLAEVKPVDLAVFTLFLLLLFPIFPLVLLCALISLTLCSPAFHCDVIIRFV